jgi:flagellar biosynthetic protein FliQ
MTSDFVLLLARESLQTIAMLCLPALAASLVVGLVVGFTQAVTQMQDQTLSFIPKIAGVGVALLLFGPWMIGTATRFCHHCFDLAMRMGHGG